MDNTFSANGHKRAICYCRVSTDEQSSNYSLPTQLDACQKYAEKAGMVIVGEFSDDFSGATPIEARPEGRKAFTMLKSGAADCLIAYAMDRIAARQRTATNGKCLLSFGLGEIGQGLAHG